MRVWPLLLLVLLLALVGVSPVSAHGEHTTAIELFEEPVGKYRLTVWSSRDSTGPGDLQLTASLIDAKTRVPVTDGQVFMTVASLDGAAPPQVMEAQLVGAVFYDVIIPISTTGRYQVTVEVRDPTGAVNQAAFDLTVQGATATTVALVYALGAFTILAAIWLFFEGTRTWRLRPRLASSSNSVLPQPKLELKEK